MDDEVMSWRYYGRLYWEDRKDVMHRKVCRKLTINHIYPSNTMKMRVFLATQVLLLYNIHMLKSVHSLKFMN